MLALFTFSISSTLSNFAPLKKTKTKHKYNPLSYLIRPLTSAPVVSSKPAAAAELVSDRGSDFHSDWNKDLVMQRLCLHKQGPLQCCWLKSWHQQSGDISERNVTGGPTEEKPQGGGGIYEGASND